MNESIALPPSVVFDLSNWEPPDSFKETLKHFYLEMFRGNYEKWLWCEIRMFLKLNRYRSNGEIHNIRKIAGCVLKLLDERLWKMEVKRRVKK